MSGQELDSTGAKILDGAVRVLGDFGVKRATVELVAKYAGVSHMTIYRRWPTKNELLRTAVVGEFTTLLDAAFGRADDTAFADQALTAFADTVWAVQNHPLVERELRTDSGEQSPLLSTNAGAVMDAGIPLVAERLRRLAATAEGAPDDVDPIADVFIRLVHSLVTIKRPDQPLTTRAEVGAYARECFGPYLLAHPGPSAQIVEAPSRHRPHLQLAAASLLGLLVLGAGLVALLNSEVKIPFVGPANISKPTAPATSAPPPAPAAPDLPAPDGDLPAAPQSPSAPEPADGYDTAQPAPEPTAPAQTALPPIGSAPRAGGPIGSGGGSSAGPVPVNPVPANQGPPGPPPPPPNQPGPKPPPPGPAGRQPGPPPAPKPPPPAPKQQPPPPPNRPGPPN